MPTDQDQDVVHILRRRQECLVCFGPLQPVLVDGRQYLVGRVQPGWEEVAFDEGLDSIEGAGYEGDICE